MGNYTVKLKLSSIRDVKHFCAIAGKCYGNVCVSTDLYTVNGKSLMGILSLDLKKVLTVRLESLDDFNILCRMCDLKKINILGISCEL